MRKGNLLTLCLLLLLPFAIAAPVAADSVTENLVSRVLESFDRPDDPESAEWPSSEWIVRGSKFVSADLVQNKEEGNYDFILGESYQYVETWPDALFGANKENKPYKVLGVHGKFDRRGYNWIEFIPAVKSDGGLVPRSLEANNEITIPGRAKTIDFWVWGANFDYYMEMHIRDFRGIVHVLNFGGIRHTGWRNLRVNIPTYIPQEGGYVTSGGYLKELKLVKLVLWTKPEERVDDFLIYIDHIKVLTDIFVSRFDGDDLADFDFIQETWNSEGGN